MKTPDISGTPLVRRAALGLAFVLSISVLVGCATDKEPYKEPYKEPWSESLSNEELRFLYPRKYYWSASPYERQELDRRMQEKLWKKRSDDVARE
jgi:hypothetical protein